MEGKVKSIRSPTEVSRSRSLMVGGSGTGTGTGTYFSDDGEGDSGKKKGRPSAEAVLSERVRGIKLSSPIRKKFRSRNLKKKKRVSVTAETDSTNRRPVNLICSEFPSDSHGESTGVGTVGVSCGAINPFSANDLPYNSAGMMLTSPMSVDSNSAGFLSENTRRRRRPTGSSPNSSYSPHSNSNQTRRSNAKIPKHNNRRGSFRVEGFNYAKALLRSDHELAKLSRKIRAEINESELYELADAAERAAESGHNNFCGKPSTFGRQHEKKKMANTKPKTPDKTEPKTITGDKADATSYTSSHQYIPSCIRPVKFQTNHDDNGESKDRIGGPVGFSEQSLLDHARAAAAAVVVGAPSVTLLTLTPNQKEPERRSMPITSLRDVNEVIPQWKELHSHMKTHFYRENVDEESLVFCETATSTATPSNSATKTNDTSYDCTSPKNNRDVLDSRRPKSFFENIASMKILPKFGPMKKSRKKNPKLRNSHGDDDTAGGTSNTSLEMSQMPIGGVAATSPSHLPMEKKDHRIPHLPTISLRSGQDRGRSSQDDNESDRYSLLTPRSPKRPDILDLDALQGSNSLGTSALRPESNGTKVAIHMNDDWNSVIGSSDNSFMGSPHCYRETSKKDVSVVKSPLTDRAPSTLFLEQKSACPASPVSTETRRNDFHSGFARSTSPSSPSTPNNSVVPRRKESGFSTPAQLRIIKRLPRNVLGEKTVKGTNGLEQSKSEDLHGYREESCVSTPAVAYCEFEPNSIVENPSHRPTVLIAKPSLKEIEAKELALPIIQSSKSENDLNKPSRKLFRRSFRSQWQHGVKSPHDSPTTSTRTESTSKMSLNDRNETRDFGCETSSSTVDPESESSTDQSEDDDSIAIGDTKSLPLSISENSINSPQQPDTSIPRTKQSEMLLLEGDNFVQNSHYTEVIDEKKECNSTVSSSDPTSDFEKDERPLFDTEARNFSLNLYPIPDDGRERDGDPVQWKTPTKLNQKVVFLEPKTGDVSSGLSLGKNDRVSTLQNRAAEWESKKKKNLNVIGTTSDSNYTTKTFGDISSNNSIHGDDGWVGRYSSRDASKDDNVSVCHSLPQTDANFKAAVQTVQNVFSHLSLGSPRDRVMTEDWKSEAENKEFLSNYFYCAKPEKVNMLEHYSTNADTAEVFDSSVNFGERLACTEPCNVRESPCFMFGIDTMCGGLADLLPNDAKTSYTSKIKRSRSADGISSRATARDRSSSISMGQIHQHGQDVRSSIDFNRHQEKSSWLSMFQKVASERLNFHFEENEVERTKHPFTPPCLSRKVLMTRSQSR
eukprot:jgi/Psemu1/323151/estExt_fgenesh1_pg.C_580033